jgi:hypothetical protein
MMAINDPSKKFKSAPVRSFSPTLLNIFKLGHEKEFAFDCGTEKKALALRARLNYLRRRLREEQHWMVPIADAVTLSIRGSVLVAHPPDSEIEAALSKALKEQGFKDEKLGDFKP